VPIRSEELDEAVYRAKVEIFLSAITVLSSELNISIPQINQLLIDIENYKNITSSAANQAALTLADIQSRITQLPAGAINDTTIVVTNAWSSAKTKAYADNILVSAKTYTDTKQSSNFATSLIF
jgi:hypothetical protein